MTTFVRNGVTYTIVYIDPSIATAGDGSTAATALKNFPSSLANNICYLVRRCDGTVSANWATSQSSVTNIMVIGMPKPTDEFYDLIDSDTKTAWDSDTGDYGIVTKSSSNYPKMTTAKQVLFDKIYFNKTYNGMNGLFYVGDSSNIANTFTFTNCKFGTIDCPLDNDAWITSNEPTSTQLRYLYCNNSIYSKNVLIKGNIINIAAYNDSSTYSLFGLYNTINCNILENTVRSVVANSETYMTNCSIFRFTDCDNSIKVLHNTIKYLIKPNTTELGLQGLLYFGSYFSISNLLIEDIDISSAPMNGGSVNTGTSTSTEQFLIYIACSSNYTSIKNINADFNTNAGAKLSLAEVLYYKPHSQKYNKQIEIDNININLCEDLAASVTSNRNVNKNALSIIGSGVGSNNIIANNINVIAPHTNALRLEDCGAININNVKGDILCGTGDSNATYATVININSLESLYHDTKCITINNTSSYSQLLLHIGTLNVVNNSATPTIPQINYQTPNYIKSTVFVDNSNALLYTDADWILTTDSTDTDTAIICPNCVVSGQYYSMMSAGSVKSSSAYRTGSSNTASLRFNRTTSSSYSVCSIGQAPFKGIMITPQSAGDYVLKIYLATTGSHDAPTFFSNFVVTSYAKENENVHIRTSNANGNIKADTSTWNGISDYTAYVVELPIHCYDTSPIEVKIDDLYYKSGFNVYLDTDIELEAV